MKHFLKDETDNTNNVNLKNKNLILNDLTCFVLGVYAPVDGWSLCDVIVEWGRVIELAKSKGVYFFERINR